MDLVGKILAGRYEIREEIGKGGMAFVYKAWCNLLNRFVAIKVLKEEFKDDREFVQRFNVEAQAAARISNPHVVAIHDVGFENGLYYIVMEYIEGITLKEYIADRGRLSWREAVSYAAQICEGLDAAHKNHVVHRDIKPQNIILTPEGVLKVTDFGIARALNNQATLTVANTAIGTVHYLSPEQARGGYTDARCDIYSLGVVLYEMLSGRLPFVDESPVAVAIKHIQEEPEPLRNLCPEIPQSVERVTLMAMNKNPEDRYATAGDFLRELRQVLIDPNGAFQEAGKSSTDTEDMDTTIKMHNIDDELLKAHEDEQNKERKTLLEAEEKTLREISEKRKMRDQKKKDRRVTWIAILSAILVVVGLSLAFSALTGGLDFFGGAATVEIPKIEEMQLEQARHEYRDQFSIIRRSEIQSDKPLGTILEQEPKAGEKVRKSGDIIIEVVVSAGNEVTTVSNYVGMERSEAQRAVISGGFQVNIIEQVSDSSEKNTVFAQEPMEGNTISPGGLITLYVSKGSESAEPSATATKEPEPSATTETTAPEASATATTAPQQTAESKPESGSNDAGSQTTPGGAPVPGEV